MRFGPKFASEIRKRRVERLRAWPRRRGAQKYVTNARDKKSAPNFLKKAMRRCGRPEKIVTDKLRSYGAALKAIGAADLQETAPQLLPSGAVSARQKGQPSCPW